MLHLVVAFASARHARDGLAFMRASSVRFEASVRPVDEPEHFAVVDLTLAPGDRGRMETLLLGVHAIVLNEEAESGSAVA